MEKGHIYTTDFTSDEEFLSWIDRKSQSKDEHILLFSRLPHRRLLEHIDINSVEAYWLTERVTEGAILPEMDGILEIILNHLSNHAGIVVLEGLEWLVTKNGEDSTLSFVRKLRDSVHRSAWSIVLPIRELAFESLWLARLRREAPSMELSKAELDIEIETYADDEISDIIALDNVEVEPLEILEDGSPRLIMLTRLPSVGFNESLLRKRILQWRRMGLDVSEVEPALTMDSEDAYALYAVVEEKVRRAVDLERQLNQISGSISATEEATSRFRIRQLTGLDELENRLYRD